MQLNKNLLKGSIILLISFNVYNALNFFFHFAMVRMLSVVQYGILASLFSIIYVLAVFTESIQTVITKYTTEEADQGKLKDILKKTFRKSFIISVALFIVYILLAILFAPLLKISYPLMVLNGTIIILAFLSPIARGILQGKKRFAALGVNMIVESGVKFVLAILLVSIGWAVYGAIIGTIVGVVVALGLSFINISPILKAKEEKASTEGIYGYTKPTFTILLIILMLYSIDVLIAKIFFSEEIAGAYAIASTLAKTIFFGTQPISRAMFPLSAENHSDEKKSENIFSNALALFIFGVLAVLALFYFLPDFIIKIFSGKEITAAAGILFYLGVAISIISLAHLILLYKLSMGKVKNYQCLFIFVVIEICLLSWFSTNIFQFTIAFITSAAIFLWGVIFLMKD